MYREAIDSKLDNGIQEFIKLNGYNIIGKLALKLREHPVGNMIVYGHTCFQAYQRSIFNERTIKQGINYVLDNIYGDNLNKNELFEFFNEYQEIYEKLVLENLRGEKTDTFILILNAKSISNDITKLIGSDSLTIKWNKEAKQKFPSLLANLCALWTLMNSSEYFEMGDNDIKSFLFKPHPAQIVSIFRMLGIGYLCIVYIH